MMPNYDERLEECEIENECVSVIDCDDGEVANVTVVVVTDYDDMA